MGCIGSIGNGMRVLSGAVAGLSAKEHATGRYRERRLTPAEIAYGDRVFEGTVPLDRVFVATDAGLGQRPFTLPKLNPRSGYVIHLGADGFADAATPTLVHELTHVWQSCHARWRWSYAANSITRQGWSWIRTRSTDGAYRYRVGRPWKAYGAEQQASIVQDWFEPSGWRTWDGQPPGESRESDPRFDYVRANVRTGLAD